MQLSCELGGASAQGAELEAPVIGLVKASLGGDLGIEDEQGGILAGDAPPVVGTTTTSHTQLSSLEHDATGLPWWTPRHHPDFTGVKWRPRYQKYPWTARRQP